MNRPTGCPVPREEDVIRIELDGSQPTEPGWYFVWYPPPNYGDKWEFVEVCNHQGKLMALNDLGCGVPVGEFPARWSRRIEIGGD